jgi:hypothetical protein
VARLTAGRASILSPTGVPFELLDLVTLRDEVRDEEASDISGRVSGLIVAGGWWLTWATEDGKEERLARLTAEKIEKLNSGQDAHIPTAKLPSNHTANVGRDHVFSN